MDADYDPNQQAASKKKKKKERKKMQKTDMPQMGKKRKKSHFAEVITRHKPVFDPRKCQSASCGPEPSTGGDMRCSRLNEGCLCFRGEKL